MNIVLITGNMASGKTRTMIDISSKIKMEEKVLYTFSSEFHSRDYEYPLEAISISQNNFFLLENPLKLNVHTRYLFFDEIQFCESILMESILVAILAEEKKHNKTMNIFMAGLLTDFNQQPFETTMIVSHLSRRIIKLRSRCDFCNTEHSGIYSVLNNKIHDSQLSEKDKIKLNITVQSLDNPNSIEAQDKRIYKQICYTCFINYDKSKN